eukprot:Rhum_TRINITY_DN4926_c0_g2::Rhum_TRINITY_DN4926_c0_g2_i1::g.16131::m.16131
MARQTRGSPNWICLLLRLASVWKEKVSVLQPEEVGNALPEVRGGRERKAPELRRRLLQRREHVRRAAPRNQIVLLQLLCQLHLVVCHQCLVRHDDHPPLVQQAVEHSAGTCVGDDKRCLAKHCRDVLRVLNHAGKVARGRKHGRRVRTVALLHHQLADATRLQGVDEFHAVCAFDQLVELGAAHRDDRCAVTLQLILAQRRKPGDAPAGVLRTLQRLRKALPLHSEAVDEMVQDLTAERQVRHAGHAFRVHNIHTLQTEEAKGVGRSGNRHTRAWTVAHDEVGTHGEHHKHGCHGAAQRREHRREVRLAHLARTRQQMHTRLRKAGTRARLRPLELLRLRSAALVRVGDGVVQRYVGGRAAAQRRQVIEHLRCVATAAQHGEDRDGVWTHHAGVACLPRHGQGGPRPPLEKQAEPEGTRPRLCRGKVLPEQHREDQAQRGAASAGGGEKRRCDDSHFASKPASSVNEVQIL